MIDRRSMKLVKFFGYGDVIIKEHICDHENGFVKSSRIPENLVLEFREELVTLAIRQVTGEDAEHFSGIDFRDNKVTFIVDAGQENIWAFNFFDGWMYYCSWNRRLWSSKGKIPENLCFSGFSEGYVQRRNFINLLRLPK